MPGWARALSIASSWAAASFLCAATALAQAPPPVAPQVDPAKLDQAKTHMEAGAAFYNDPSGHKCEEALREFTKAYVLSGSLNALRGAGICALELERDGEAIEMLDRYVREKGAGIDPADKKQLDADLAALKAAVARVSLTVDRPKVRITTVRTPSRGYPITNRYELAQGKTELGIHPGSYVVTASAAGEKDLSWTVEIPNGGTLERAFEWTAAPAAAPGAVVTPPPSGGDGGDASPSSSPDDASGGERPIPTTVWIFGGVTVALAIPMTIFMISASGARSDFDAANGTASTATLEDLRSDVTTMNLVSDVFLGATVASAATTAIFYFTRPTVSSASAQPRRHHPADRAGLALGGDVLPEVLPEGVKANLVPVVGHQGGGAFVSGSF